MKFVDEEDGQYADGEITNCGKCTVNVGHDHDDLHIHACAHDIRVKGHASPEVFQWFALEEHEEHENQACNNGQGHDAVEEPDVEGSDSDAHQEDADGDLAPNRGEAVGDLAEPPIFHCEDAIVGSEVFEPIACAVNCASNHGSAEHGVE